MSLEALSKQRPDLQITTDPENLKTYGKDWTKHIEPKPEAVVFPKTTEDVVELVKWARGSKKALIPSGGRTGLSGAATATNGEIIVSFERMNQILEFDPYDQVVTCEPGVITETLQNYAKEKGLFYPVDFAARGSSHIGGNIATNAGGIKVLRYGLTRSWIAGIEVVTGAGEVLNLGKSLVKNATGYDLKHLFIGSEGTLGFITKVDVQLTREPNEPLLFLFSVPELDSVMKIYHAYRSKLPVMAFEMFTDLSLDYTLKHTGLGFPLEQRSNYYVLLEIEGGGEEVLEQSMAIFEKGLDEAWMADGTMAQSAQQAKDMWRFREDITESTDPYKPYKNDVSVRVSKVPQFLTEIDELLKREYPSFPVVWFGHIGDGNLHINILKPEDVAEEQFLSQCRKVNEVLMARLEEFGGSVSAEHGVGLTKKPYLHHSRSAEEIAIMRSIKNIFDPDGIMNPGKVFD